MRPARLLCTLAALAAFTALPACGHSSDTSAISDEQAREALGVAGADVLTDFYRRLTAAVERNDVNAVAALLHYPLLFGNDENRSAGAPSQLAAPADLPAQYDSIFTETIRRVLACRTPADFAVSSEGVMIGHGALWFSRVYVGDASVSRPIAPLDDDPDWRLRVIAVYDGAHAERDARQCEAQ